MRWAFGVHEKNHNQPGFFSDGENNFPVNPEQSSDSTYWVAARCDWGIQYLGGCLVAIAQWQSMHWQFKSEVSWVRLAAAAALFTFLYIFASKHLNFQCEASCSEYRLFAKLERCSSHYIYYWHMCYVFYKFNNQHLWLSNFFNILDMANWISYIYWLTSFYKHILQIWTHY